MKTQILYRLQIVILSLLVALALAGYSVVFFTRLDNIVHSDLYRYGLQFSDEWANEYWNYSRLTLSFLGVGMLLTGVSTVLTLLQVRTQRISLARLVNSILLVTGILMFVLSIFFFTRLDYFVHNDLYNYGLQFSGEWANQYWNYSRLMRVFLGVTIGMSGISGVLVFRAPASKIKPASGLSSLRRVDLTRLICYILTSAGAIALALSINYDSSILAFVGLGLIFWGVILFYVRPENYVKETLLDKTTLPSLTNLNEIIKEIGYKGKGVYLPPKYFKSFESSKVYISAGEDIKLPPPEKTREEEDKTFINNPNGALITPPGIELKRLFEKTLGTNFARVDLQFIEQNTPKLLVEDLEIAQEVEMEHKNNRVFVKIENSIYQNICKEARKLSKICCSLGCPLCSAIACALAEATGRSVVIEKEETSDENQTTKIEYHLLKEPREEQRQK
jgi:hypothetical protein